MTPSHDRSLRIRLGSLPKDIRDHREVYGVEQPQLNTRCTIHLRFLLENIATFSTEEKWCEPHDLCKTTTTFQD